MVDVDKMSDAELRTKLIEYGFPVMPITGTTRKLMVKKLKLLQESKNKTANDNRRSLGRYSSEEESDTDVRSSKKDKNRRATMAAPPVSPGRPGVTLRKSLRRNDSDDISESGKDVVKSSKRTMTTTKTVKTVQDEFDTGSDSEPEIIENDYDSTPPQVTNSYEYKKESPIQSTFSPSSPYRFQQSTSKYSPPKTVSSSTSVSSSYSFSNKQASPSRYTTYTSNTNNDVALDRLNQIRSRLSLGNTGYDRPAYPSPVVDTTEEKVETPFLSNFTRRLSQLSSANSPKPEYEFKNDIIKEHDTNGAGTFSRSYLGRAPRYRDINRDYYSQHDRNIFKDNVVSFAVCIVAGLFFIVVGVMYYGMRNNDNALDITVADSVIPRCVKLDPNAKPGINCIFDEDLADAIGLKNIIKPELMKRAIAFHCNTDTSAKSYMTEPDIINYQHKLSTRNLEDVKQNLHNLEVLIFKNPDWGIAVIQTDEKSDVTEQNILGSMEEVNTYRPSRAIGLTLLNPDIPWRCIVYNKVYAVFNTLAVLICGFFILYFGNLGYKYFMHYQQQKKDEVFNMVERIVEALQTTSGNEGDNFLVINHVRDMILPITDRKRLEKTWEEAVRFINENESRVRTEVQVVQGEPFEVWRWLGSPNLNTSSSPRSKTWQGQAFETQVGSVNSLPCSPTPCLKVRGMVDDNERNYPAIREAVLSKCAHQCRILHCGVDNATKCVYLKCADQTDAAIAYRNLHGWWYAGHLVTVKYLRLERYNTRFPESPDSGPPYLKSLSPPTDWTS